MASCVKRVIDRLPVGSCVLHDTSCHWAAADGCASARVLLVYAAGKPEVEAQIDAVLSRFVARANEVRNQLNSQAWGPGKALDEVRTGGEHTACAVLCDTSSR